MWNQSVYGQLFTLQKVYGLFFTIDRYSRKPKPKQTKKPRKVKTKNKVKLFPEYFMCQKDHTVSGDSNLFVLI